MLCGGMWGVSCCMPDAARCVVRSVTQCLLVDYEGAKEGGRDEEETPASSIATTAEFGLQCAAAQCVRYTSLSQAVDVGGAMDIEAAEGLGTGGVAPETGWPQLGQNRPWADRAVPQHSQNITNLGLRR